MKKKVILGLLLAVTTTQTVSVAQASNADAGTIIGGVIGGLFGNQFGGGNGKTAATIIGAIVGSSIGNKVGAEMDENDRRALAEAQSRALQGRLNGDCDWDGRNYGSRSGARGRITSTREGYNQYTGEYCREYSSVIYLNNRTEETTGTACSRRDGSWYEVRQTQVRWNGGGMDSGRPGRYNPSPAPVPAPAPVPVPPPAPVQSNRGTSVQVSAISRRSGGEWVRLSFSRPVYVQQLEVRALSAGVAVHAATVYTTSGRQFAVREFNETPTFYAGDKALSEVFNFGGQVTTVDLRLESMGGNADVLLTAYSSDAYVSVGVTRY